eukprot:TRINITY_DN1406_c0_g1_i2.p1 TRINITY_DN1406_c0_g1~~TRINITY_DN1406_c0_g1_i2.p1  ORF type:complete len:107 (-),score=36.12 TRINITY_DN1406_c0_g1_i2:171-491(-)
MVDLILINDNLILRNLCKKTITSVAPSSEFEVVIRPGHAEQLFGGESFYLDGGNHFFRVEKEPDNWRNSEAMQIARETSTIMYAIFVTIFTFPWVAVLFLMGKKRR